MHHHRRSRRRLPRGAAPRPLAALLLAAAFALPSAAASGATWSLQTTPEVGATESFEGVSCTTERSCMAVGVYRSEAGATLALTETWDGSSWTQHAAALARGASGGEFFDVSCTSESACTAVGNSLRVLVPPITTRSPIAERWNGREWSVQTLATPAGARAWSIRGVHCSSASACTAVGSLEEAGGTVILAETWNGTEWSVQTTPRTSGELDEVSCTSASACTAVGQTFGEGGLILTLAARWDGRAWTVQRTPNGEAEFSFLEDVSCTTATSCVAVGETFGRAGTGSPLTAVWNGTTWVARAAPTPAETEHSALSGVSCTSERACIAVGLYRTRPEVAIATLAEQWNGERWTVATPPNPRSSRQTTLEAVSCTTSVLCTAVGHSTVAATEALAERFS